MSMPLPSPLIASSEGLSYNLMRLQQEQAEAILLNKALIAQTLSDEAPTTESTAIDTTADKIISANANSKRIAKTSAKQIAEKAMRERVSRRLLLAKRSEVITCACEVTGIVSQLDMPQIPFNKQQINQQKIVTSLHPLARIENARGFAQAGIDYLRRLDTGVLAGVLIVLADEYELFRYSVGDSGVQKNAILRTTGKDQIIDTILMIEDLIHNGNNLYLPRLSMILEADMLQGAMAGRLQSWTKLVAETIYENHQREDEDEFYAAIPRKQITPQYVRDAEKAEKAAKWSQTKAKWDQQRTFKQDKTDAIAALKRFVCGNHISIKLSQMIKGIFTDDTLLTISSEMKVLLINKLSEFNSSDAEILISVIKKEYKLLTAKVLSLDDLDNPLSSDNGLAQGPGQAPSSQQTSESTESEQTEQIESEEADPSEGSEAEEEEDDNPSTPPAQGEITISIDGVEFNVPEAFQQLGTMDKLRYKQNLKNKYPDYFIKG